LLAIASLYDLGIGIPWTSVAGMAYSVWQLQFEEFLVTIASMALIFFAWCSSSSSLSSLFLVRKKYRGGGSISILLVLRIISYSVNLSSGSISANDSGVGDFKIGGLGVDVRGEGGSGGSDLKGGSSKVDSFGKGEFGSRLASSSSR
jgi:hypothetical protein